MGRLLIGTSSWSDQGSFYPPWVKQEGQLAYYATHFPVVEVNTSYYHVPRRSMVERWVERTPEEFVFDVKPPRELTWTPSEPGGEAPEPDADLNRRLFEEHRIEIPVSHDGTLLRISIAPYNDRADVDRLLAALARELHA